MPLRRNSILGIGVCLLAGCGGGSGDSPVNVTPATIQQENAELIAVEVLQATDLVAGISRLSTLPMQRPVIIESAAQGEATVQAAATELSDTLPCGISGNVQISGTLADPFQLTRDDQITHAYDECRPAMDRSLDGTVRFDVLDFSGLLNFSFYDVDLALTISDLQMTDGDLTYTVDGQVRMTQNAIVSPSGFGSLSGSSLTVHGSEVWQVRDFLILHTYLAGDPMGIHTTEATGTLVGSGFAGAVDFVTTEPISVIVDGRGYPDSGELVISGAGGANLRLIILDGNNVQLALDLDGDGEPEEIRNRQWQELLPPDNFNGVSYGLVLFSRLPDP